MSVYSSICREDHNDPMDVAYSCVENEIRLVDWNYENDGTTIMTTDQARHLIALIEQAIKMAERYE